MVTEVTERALAHTEKREVLLTGGVAANKRLQDMLSVIAGEHDATFMVVPKAFASDNGAMIAWTGVLCRTCMVWSRLLKRALLRCGGAWIKWMFHG